MLQRSRSSGGFVFPPRIAEPGTGARDLEWTEADGAGTLYAVTFIAKKDPSQSYNVALVDLVEGPRVLTRLDNVVAETAVIGMPLRARIVEGSTGPLLVFVPGQPAAEAERAKEQA
ncbi:OB-fold domain-containing protein [Parapusillimonas sp. SGNA-6]|nr:OB-fold domain-containing protein [Parapusillimonas sp. SGNA-6]